MRAAREKTAPATIRGCSSTTKRGMRVQAVVQGGSWTRNGKEGPGSGRVVKKAKNDGGFRRGGQGPQKIHFEKGNVVQIKRLEDGSPRRRVSKGGSKLRKGIPVSVAKTQAVPKKSDMRTVKSLTAHHDGRRESDKEKEKGGPESKELLVGFGKKTPAKD